ncbi:MAG: hypothetical protein CMB80_24340 [Flammeovirgaceae bacterium]|nr:hypothetical protein [Flammeovirgaceae bacterium]MBE63746.1 hypothetical protein [Flammeovirgaceae bacterium]
MRSFSNFYILIGKINQYLTQKLASKGLGIDRLKTKEQILALIRKLHPIQCEHNLIRIGPIGDGGYLVPDDLNGIIACFSPGVGNVSEFEIQCSQLGMEIFLADASVDRPDNIPSSFHFTKKFIGPGTQDEYLSLDDWVSESGIDSTGDILLQMDIEGYEYLSLINISDKLLKRCRVIVIEFHDLQKMWEKDMFEFYSWSFKKLLKNHSCVHIHPNNCDGMDSRNGLQIPRMAEFTFYRNDRFTHRSYAKDFPHTLDCECVPKSPSVELPSIWYRHD